MVNWYVYQVEEKGMNMNNVSSKWRTDVEKQVIADGYTINKDGTVTK